MQIEIRPLSRSVLLYYFNLECLVGRCGIISVIDNESNQGCNVINEPHVLCRFLFFEHIFLRTKTCKDGMRLCYIGIEQDQRVMNETKDRILNGL